MLGSKSLLLITFFVSLLLLVFPFYGLAADDSVSLNEIAWAGTKANPDHEWMELANNTDEEIDLDGWLIRFREDTNEEWKKITLEGTISPRGYYLLERLTDKAVSDLSADQLYDEETPQTLSLSDSGESVQLVDPEGMVVDTANENGANRDWPAGSTDPPGSMERVDPAKEDDKKGWETNDGIVTRGADSAGNPINGTPSMINKATLLEGRSLPKDPRKIDSGKVFSFLTAAPSVAPEDVDGLLLGHPARQLAGGAGRSDSPLSVGKVPEGSRYHCVFDTSKVAPGSYRIFLLADKRLVLSQYVKVVG